MLVCHAGSAIVCRQWSSFPIRDGNYEPLEPAILGTDLLFRPDLYGPAMKVVGLFRLRLGLSLQLST